MTAYSLIGTDPLINQLQRRSSAAALYNASRAMARRRRLWAGLAGRSTALRSLKAVQPQCQGGHFAGRKHVKLADIRGTEGRAGDFDDQFYPLSDETRRRWQSVASALEAGAALPPVQLIQVGADYYVRDGHHRVSVARALGQDAIEAEVTLWTGN
jgi:hypothetical protein